MRSRLRVPALLALSTLPLFALTSGSSTATATSTRDVRASQGLFAPDGRGSLVNALHTSAPKSVVPAPRSDGTLSVPLARPQAYLSGKGREVRESVTSTRPAAPSRTTAQTSKPHTDCRKAKCIALTFDDGPGPYTGAVLDTLVKKHAKATFFTLGPAVQASPGTMRRMADLGMGLGDHSWTHPQFTRLSASQVTAEITKQATALKKATGQAPIAVRPPYGAFTKATPHAGYPFVLWDVDTEDWKNRNADTTTRRALSGAHRGAIVLMHDIHPSTAKALPGLIDALQKQGYTLVTINDLLPTMSTTGAYYAAPKTAG